MMRTFAVVVFAIAVSMAAFACGRETTTAPVIVHGSRAPLRIDGTWTGSGADEQGVASFTLTLVQSDTTVSGTAITRGNVGDGTCASCHKSTNGTVTGILSGSTLTLSMFFPSGNDGVPTPMCSVRMNATASVSGQTIAADYSGEDSCEGPILRGSFTISNGPPTKASR